MRAAATVPVRHAEPAEVRSAAEAGPACEMVTALVFLQPLTTLWTPLDPQLGERGQRGSLCAPFRLSSTRQVCVVLLARHIGVEHVTVLDADLAVARLARPEHDVLAGDVGHQLTVATVGLWAPAELRLFLESVMEKAALVVADEGTL